MHLCLLEHQEDSVFDRIVHFTSLGAKYPCMNKFQFFLSTDDTIINLRETLRTIVNTYQ